MMAILIDTFREEAAEQLNELDLALVELERRPDDRELVHAVFRLMHTLKGSSAIVGFTAFSSLAHELETIFEEVRSGTRGVDRHLISLTLQGGDLLRRLTTATDPEHFAVEVTALCATLRERSGAAPPGVAAVAPLPPGTTGETLYLIRFVPPLDILRRGLDPQLLLEELFNQGHGGAVARTAKVPLLDELDAELCYLGWDVLLASAASADELAAIFLFVAGESELRIERLPLPAGVVARTLVEPGLALLRGGDCGDAASLGERLATKVAPLPVPEPPRQVVALETASIRVKASRLDTLVNLIGELVTVQARLGRAVTSGETAALEAISEEVERLTWGLRDEVLTLRMVPIGATFGRLQRLVRDLAGQLGKEVELVVDGAETELDKTLIDGLQDPLMHLVRNCVDHGIESPEVRQAGGKPRRGRIRVSAVHAGAQVLLTVSDDGAGLNRERIARRGEELGLLDGEALPGDREIEQLIFAPGFSTAGAVTSVSGRGVGMDVVQRVIARLRGRIDVRSTPGAGTSFELRLPLTLAIIDGLLVDVAGEVFVLPLDAVEECLDLPQEGGRRRELVALRGATLPFIDLRRRFALAGDGGADSTLVVVHADGERVGLAVDRVLGEHQTVVKPLKAGLTRQSDCSGATILGDGRVALILDVPRLVAGAIASELRLTGS